MNCPYCGKRNPNNDLYCRACRKPLPNEEKFPEDGDAARTQEPRAPADGSASARSDHSSLSLGIVGLLVGIGSAVCAFLSPGIAVLLGLAGAICGAKSHTPVGSAGCALSGFAIVVCIVQYLIGTFSCLIGAGCAACACLLL